MQIQQNLL